MKCLACKLPLTNAQGAHLFWDRDGGGCFGEPVVGYHFRCWLLTTLDLREEIPEPPLRWPGPPLVFTQAESDAITAAMIGLFQPLKNAEMQISSDLLERHVGEDAIDSAVAMQRLAEIKASPERVIRGDALAKRLEALI